MTQPVEVQPVDGDPLASIGQRIIARLIDWLLIMAVALVIGLVASGGDADADVPVWAILVTVGFVFVYETALVHRVGQTLGKRIAGIEIVVLADGSRPGLVASAARVVPVVVLLVLLQQFAYIALVFVYFSAAFMPNQRGVLDLAAGTVVVQARSRSRTVA